MMRRLALVCLPALPAVPQPAAAADATDVPATLTVRGRRFATGRRARRVAVRVRRGRNRLVLGLRLRSGGRTGRSTVIIPRS